MRKKNFKNVYIFVFLCIDQQSLKEKEGHIAQLLKERDFERAEFTRAAQKFEQTESKLAEFSKQLEEKDTEIKRLSETISSLVERKTSLLAQCELDRTKIEDLEFQIEEHKLGCAKADASVTESPPAPVAAEPATPTKQDDGKQSQIP